MTPSYQRPEAPVAESYPSSEGGGVSALSEGLGWESFFGDPRLQSLIELSLENNRDLRKAGLQVERIAAIYNIQRSVLIPSLDGTASGTRTRTPGDLTSSGSAQTSSQYQIGIGIPSYELDFFGRVRSLKNQVLEQYLATEEAKQSAQLSLVTAVARQYLMLLAAEEQLGLAQQSLEVAERAYGLNEQTYEAGVSNELDLRTAESQRAAVRSRLAGIEQTRAQLENGLIELVGSPLPSDLPPMGSLAGQNLLETLPAGIPSDLLMRRPDIRAAEHQLKAAYANIGVARAAFFPSVKLTAFGGTASAELSGLFEDGSGMWRFAPTITLPLFAAGKNKAQLEVASIEQRMEIASYEKTIQTAFREVADALATRAFIDRQIESEGIRVASSQRRYELSSQRFEAGVDSFVPVLLAQQELFSAEQSLVEVRLRKLTNATALYGALGGGWNEPQVR